MPELDARPKMTHAPARHSALVTLPLRRCVQDLSVRTPKRELGCEQKHVERIAGRWRASASCWWATLAGVVPAPILLWCAPSRHPVGEARIAVVGRGGGTGRSATGALPRAALSMHPAAPLLLAHRPSNHPVGEAISAVVRVGRRSWRDWRDGHWHWHWHWQRDWLLRAALSMDPAAPRLLVCLPPVRCVHCAIVRVDWTDRPRRLCWARRRPWRCRWRGWRRRWRRCRRRSGLRSCWCLSGAADSAHLAALLLLWRPHRCCCRDRCSQRAIVELGGGSPRQEPEQQRQQQEQAQQAARRDEACEIPPRADCIEVATASNILVGGLLHVLALAMSHI